LGSPFHFNLCCAMSFRQSYHAFIIGSDQFILPPPHYKRVLLTGQLCVITMVLCGIYLVSDLVNGNPYPWPFQAACAVLAFISFMLNRRGQFTAAKVIFGLAVNFTIFLFASSIPLETGLYMYFITVSLGAMVAFGYEERYKAMLFVLLSTVLFVISLFWRISFIPIGHYSLEYLRWKTLLNFLGAGWASVGILYFLVSIHYRSESVLIRNEKEIRTKNRELTDLNTNLDRFVYGTSHDLRSPLSSLRGLIQITELTTDLNEVRSCTAEMKKRIDHLEKFIRDIADYSRNRSQGVQAESIHLRKLLIESLENLRYFPGASELLISLEVDEQLIIVGDPFRLQIVLNNLLSNAFKYRDGTKEKSFVILRGEVTGTDLVITVEDNGLGIPDTHITRIFDMYVRAHETSHGSGLGLYIVKETVEKLGGKIQVASEVPLGTSFTITIPIPRQAENTNAQAESRPA
jgi:signal transduction histidine kinase